MDSMNNVLLLLNNMTEPLGSLLRNALGEGNSLLTEIRLHCGLPAVVYFGRKARFLCEDGIKPSADNRAYRPSRKDLANLLARLCEYSLYAKEEELRNGYLTVRGGHRIGVCTGYLASGCVDYGAIGSVNIRVAREFTGCGKRVAECICEDGCRGVLIAGPPMCGKTTVLRDAVRLLAGNPHYKKVSVVDERREIAACWMGVPSMDVAFADVLDGFRKEEGIQMAMRALSPEIIACDELLCEGDVQALTEAAAGGVLPLATVHARSAQDARSRRYLRPLFESGCISHIVALSPTSLGAVSEIVRVASR